MDKIIDPTISIIVPVYNTAPYLRECVDSILAQSFSDWELLLIDDGSTDESSLICDNYSLRDRRIITIHQTNKGPSGARNTGLDNARGEYIAFLDADDVFLDNSYLEIHHDISKKNNADISICRLMRFRNRPPYSETPEKDLAYIMTSGPEFCTHKYREYNRFFGSAYSKLFRSILFDHLRFPDNLIFAEDNAIIHRLYYPSERIALIDREMYGHRTGHIGQYMRVDIKRKLQDLEAAFTDRENYYLAQGREDLAAAARNSKNRHIAQAIRVAFGKKDDSL